MALTDRATSNHSLEMFPSGCQRKGGQNLSMRMREKPAVALLWGCCFGYTRPLGATHIRHARPSLSVAVVTGTVTSITLVCFVGQPWLPISCATRFTLQLR
jgi:hypothetical protein